MPRTPLLIGSTCCALLLPGCGSAATDAPAPVRVTIAAPSDGATVREARVIVRGTVRPADAQVLVRGTQAKISGGRFSADVVLEAGVNVVDVLASAGDARPALTAIRVRRLTTVSVPDVLGLAPDEATSRLEDIGLQADIQQRGGSLFDDLLGREPAVCTTDPAPRTEVAAGATVVVEVARRC